MSSKILVGNNKWFIDDELIRYNNKTINWGANIGKPIEFQCFDYHGKYTIKEDIVLKDGCHNNKHSYMIYFSDDIENTYTVNAQTLRKVNFSYILGFYSHDFLYNVGDIVNNQFLVLKREYKKLFASDKSKIKVYTCQCLIDGYVFENSEKNLKTQIKCEVCLGKVVMKGVNDIATTRPQLVKYLKNKDDAYKYTAYTNKILDFKCDICGREFQTSPNAFGFNFPCGCYSSDSYPNKLIREIFDQLKIPYIYELRKRHFAWCEKYRYDLYFEINNKSYIVEMDGGLHKGERLEIDKQKDELAQKNGVKVIRIDCDYDKMENRLSYIKNNLMQSELNSIINLCDVNWNVIDMKILENNITKKICDLRNKGYTNAKIANKLNITLTSVDSHLKIGKNNGLLNEWASSNNLTKSIVVEVINLENNMIQYCIGICNFYNNAQKYIGIKANHHLLKKHTVNGHTVLNGYEIRKISYYEYLIKTARI